jgi:hypothetical protein
MLKIVTSLFVLGFLAAHVGADDTSGDRKAEPRVPKKLGRGKFTISKETTYVTRPVDKDGYIDYVTALNERLREGATPGNNANVLIWKMFGPHPEGVTMSADFFKWMGIDSPPEKGEYSYTMARYFKEQFNPELDNPEKMVILNQIDVITRFPWAAKDFPHMAAWITRNDKTLALAHEAGKRTHFYNPLVPPVRAGEGPALVNCLLPAVQKTRELASIFVGRAMLRTSEGKTNEAWQDLLACHRLGRLLSKGGTTIEVLVGLAIDNLAFRADLAFIEHTKPSARQVQSYLADLRKLPPHVPPADKVDLCERFEMLEVVMVVDRRGSDLVGDDVLRDIDWDPALKNANKWYDRTVSAMRIPDRAQRKMRMTELEKELKETKARVLEKGVLATLAMAGPEARGKAVGDLLITQLFPQVQKVQQAWERTQQNQDNLLVALTLAAYERDHGSYPPELATLIPKYLDKLPTDLFSGQPLIYKLTDRGYLLYSVGVNGKDDGGKGYDDGADDLVVKMPAREKK